jgi:hypothetical protein
MKQKQRGAILPLATLGNIRVSVDRIGLRCQHHMPYLPRNMSSFLLVSSQDAWFTRYALLSCHDTGRRTAMT